MYLRDYKCYLPRFLAQHPLGRLLLTFPEPVNQYFDMVREVLICNEGQAENKQEQVQTDHRQELQQWFCFLRLYITEVHS